MTKQRKPSRSLIRSPEPVSGDHIVSEFDSGEATLDSWLRQRAMKNESAGASRTYVVCEQPGMRVVAYYCLAAGAIVRDAVPSQVRRNMPDPLPVIVIGRLAVDRNYQGHGLGRALLRDAVLRIAQAANIAGVRAILVHAISSEAREFYVQAGFRPSSVDPMTLLVTVVEAQQILVNS